MKRTVKIFALLLVIDLFAAGGLWWGYDSMQGKKIKEGELRTGLVMEDQRAKNLIALNRKLVAVEKEQAEMEKFLHDSSDEAQIGLVSQIEKLGTSTTGAIVETVSFDLSADAKPSLRGSFSVKGTWPQLYHFLRLLEEYPSNLDVIRFEAKGSSSGGMWTGGASFILGSLKNGK